MKVTTHLEDLADFTECNVADAELFTEPYLVRATVGARLANIPVAPPCAPNAADAPWPVGHGASVRDGARPRQAASPR